MSGGRTAIVSRGPVLEGGLLAERFNSDIEEIQECFDCCLARIEEATEPQPSCALRAKALTIRRSARQP